MRGYYPSVSKVLLAILGPYERIGTATHNTAYVMLKKLVYAELQNLSKLYENKPSKIVDFLPANVSYDHASNTLIHTYTSGKLEITNLSSLEIERVDIFDKSTWR